MGLHGDGREAAPRKGDLRRAKPSLELWLPVAYLVLAGLWITFSDRAVGLLASSVEQAARWSMWKGMAFVALTTVLLHAGIRWTALRERRARERLEANEALLRAVMDAVADPVFLKDREGRWQFANLATYRVIGRTEGQVLGRTDLEIYDDPEIGRALMATDRRIMENDRGEVVEEDIVGPEGRRLFLSTKAPVRGPHGHVVGVVGSARDITERKASERALAESEGRFRAIFEQAAVGVAQIEGATGRFLRVNQRFAETLGRTPEELRGLRWQDVVHPDDLASHATAEAALRAGESRAFTRTARHLKADGGVVWGNVTVSAMGGKGEPSADRIVVLVDITAQRTLEEQLHQAQRLESVGRLAGGIAHDFNNLLTVILACAGSLRAGPLPPGGHELEDVEEIQAAARRASELTRRLLAFARKQVITPVALDLAEVLRGTERLLHRLLGEDVRVSIDAPPGLWAVRFDAGQLEQVIMNLAANARDAMPAGGTFRLAVSNVVLPRDGGEAPGPGDWVKLVVSDTGEGMAPEVLEHLFEPFFTTKAPGAGTGLGLATVYGILRQNGAHVAVESTPGQGTRFELWLPRCEAPVSQAPAPGREETPDPRGSCVLLVEDEPAVRQVVERTLRKAGYQVLVAASAEEALARPDEEVARAALLLTDVVMPGQNGPALAAELRRRHPALRVLFMSGYTGDAIARHGVLEQGVELLTKPFTPEALLGRVRDVLERSPACPVPSPGLSGR